ncbi:MAG TPA: helix-turn-helix transcriptional regulator [Pseudonocardiaceae bacterium]
MAAHRELQRAAGGSMAPSSVSRLLRRQLGTTLTEYLTTVRLAAASRALTDTDRPIADIAHSCGFPNLANFNRRFRGSRQLTPREYRRALRS